MEYASDHPRLRFLDVVVQAMEYAMQLGKEAAALVTHQFPSPISLEFEKAKP